MKSLYTGFFIATAYLLSASYAAAQAPFNNPLRARSLMELVHALLEAVIYIGTLGLLIAFVYTGALFVFAQGKDEELKKARSALVWTVVGGVVLLGAEGIARILEATAMRLE